jgi:hypothetical protein
MIARHSRKHMASIQRGSLCGRDPGKYRLWIVRDWKDVTCVICLQSGPRRATSDSVGPQPLVDVRCDSLQQEGCDG